MSRVCVDMLGASFLEQTTDGGGAEVERCSLLCLHRRVSAAWCSGVSETDAV
jgi:hypothetical protein